MSSVSEIEIPEVFKSLPVVLSNRGSVLFTEEAGTDHRSGKDRTGRRGL